MTTWIIALLLLASLAGMGYRQGVIRVAFSFVGIIVGAILATPLAPLVRLALSPLGVKQPLLVWLVPPVVMFAVVLATFKFIGLAVHNKVEAHYKYKTDDLTQALWERLSRRLGLCLSTLNATAYLILVSFVLYAASYWTIQLAPSAKEPRWIRLLNQAGWDMQGAGLDRVGWAVDRLPASYYDAADLAGILYHTPPLDLEARLFRYPPFLGLSERPEFQGIYNDNDFTQFWSSRPPLGEFLKHPRIAPLLKTPALLKTSWSVAEPNLLDLAAFLTNGVSQKYDGEKIVGRWKFDINSTMSLLRRARPEMPPKEMLLLRNSLIASYAKTTLVAMTQEIDQQQARLKNVPRWSQAAGMPTLDLRMLTGQWKSAGSRYALSFNSDSGAEEMAAEFKGERLALSPRGLGLELAFQKEED
jgi:hypothetical protein